MGKFDEFYEAREQISDILFKDFIGPVTRDEILGENPATYYIMGKLYPQSDQDAPADIARTPLLDNQIETYDASISLSNQANPSSMGITFTLRKSVNVFMVSGSFAFYDPVEFSKVENNIDTSKWAVNPPKELWRRQEYNFTHRIEINTKHVETVELERGMELQIYTHAVLDNGDAVITVVLLNKNRAVSNQYSENQTFVGSTDNIAHTAFQAKIHVCSEYQNECIFTEANHESYLTDDPELQDLDLIYSDVHSYGQGHGCSILWDEENIEPLWIESTFFPTFNLKQMKAADIQCDNIFSMKMLSEGSSKEIINGLRNFNAQYRKWIDDRAAESDKLNDNLKKSADRNIEKCREAYRRIENSIDLLERSDREKTNAMLAFRYANEAMLLQREQTLKKEGKPFEESQLTWYPFQLAFILHEISSFICPESKERKMVDLLWFPTGGGKTEAYLGIAAFVIFLRRLNDPDADGVTVIMRYTLRLLTLQQFERASMLICACEKLRREHNIGGADISIGLWVGGNLTPNDLKGAAKNLRIRQQGDILMNDQADPCQILRCPWCGAEILPSDYNVDSNNKRMYIRCPNHVCDFHNITNGLPIHIIDEDIYENLPTFIVATVDKFAQIPWNDKPASLFGIGRNKKKPELIIQDELHLISGPLGTITGIYEAAISMLCESNGIPAKVIASTATIRNAGNQIKALYGREHTQFPPQGLSAKDSFFAVESSVNEKPARKYYGVLGVGVTATTTLIRVNAALLFATRYLACTHRYGNDVIDNFWTLTGYFNSIRELGGATTQIMDDVQGRFSFLANTKFANIYPGVNAEEHFDNVQELTSRMDNHEITKVIQEKLKNKYVNGQHSDVYDFVLATNMISVGVDVGRLGIMVVTGQPKTNAEYIQATSRVGRSNPGLVITVYNPSRSRDRSHYEQFLKYHSALYRYVEATSLTPFSDRARDRGLHALFISLCRYLIKDLRRNTDAVFFNRDDPKVQNIEKRILDYVLIVDPSEMPAVKEELDEIERKWDREASGSLAYKGGNGEKSLLISDTDTVHDTGFPTMNSMRNVDAECGIWLYRR